MSLWMKARIRFLFYAETAGAAMYHKMASQYSSLPEASRLLRQSGDQEARHGRLFHELYRDIYGKTLAGEALLTWQGRLGAFFLRPLPLKVKVFSISMLESIGATSLKILLGSGKDTPLFQLLRDILPDEEFHAALYEKIYG